MQDVILILNYSSEFSLETARRLRDVHVYAQVINGMTTAAQIRKIAPSGIVMSGEPDGGTGVFDAGILELDIPILALGHAAHMLLAAQGGVSTGAAQSEKKVNVQYGDSALFAGVTGGERVVGEMMTLMLPPDVRMTASAGGCTAAFEHVKKRQYGIQFELERNDPDGTTILRNFACDICGCATSWSVEKAMQTEQTLLEAVAQEGKTALVAVSGGVDSTVSAVLAHRAFGEKMRAVLVDTGLMRDGESEQIAGTFAEMGVPFVHIDRSAQTLEALAGKISMAEKRGVILRCVRDAMLEQANKTAGEKLLVIGTNYTESVVSGKDTLWQECGLDVAEPVGKLFKREVRAAAELLGLPQDVVNRKPFAITGMASRIVGEVTAPRLHALRTAERIFTEEITEAGLARKMYKYFPVLASVGMPGAREVILLRAVQLSGGMLIPARLPHDLVERTVQRIMETEPIVARVFVDETPTKVGMETFS